MRTIVLLAAAIIIFAAGYVSAGLIPASAVTNMAGMDHSAGAMVMDGPRGDTGPSSEAFAKANAEMHEAMNIEFSGKPDVDFAKGMIAHHRGAVDMAKVQLEYGTDPDLRALAEQIIAAQQPEIDQMTEWLKANGN